MTAPITMNQVIHGAVRRDLDRLSTALARLTDGDQARAQALDRAYANLRDRAHPPPRGRGRLRLADALEASAWTPAAGGHGERAPRMSKALAETAGP